MKRCPDCHRDYYDDSLNFCLDDGSGLLDGPASDPSFDEPETAIFQLPGNRSSSTPLYFRRRRRLLIR